LLAFGALIAGDALSGVAAGQEPFNSMGDDRAKEAVVFGIDTVIALLKVSEMLIDNLKQGAFVKEPWPIISRVSLLHKQQAEQESCLDGEMASERRLGKPAKGLAGFLSVLESENALQKTDEKWTSPGIHGIFREVY